MKEIEGDAKKAAIRSIEDMISRSEKAQGKFAPGTAQHTLQINRIHALKVAVALIERDMGGGALPCTREELRQAQAPLASLMSKSEKAQTKVAPGSWQHTMLEGNLAALRMALPLLEGELERDPGAE